MWITLVVALIGVAVALGAVYFGHWLATKSEAERFERDITRQKKDFASTLALEVEGIVARLNTALKADYREPPAAIQESYFTVFDSNTNILMLLEEVDAQNALHFYLGAKRHFDALREFRDLWYQWRGPASGLSHEQIETLHKQLQQSQQEVSRAATFALRSLKKY